MIDSPLESFRQIASEPSHRKRAGSIKMVRQERESHAATPAKGEGDRDKELTEAFLLGVEAARGRAKTGDGHVPRTPRQRIEMFRQLANAFVDAAETLGKQPMLPSGEPGSTEHRQHVWQGLFKMMLLRKFYSPGDHVQIPKVIRALRELAVESHNTDLSTAADSIEIAWNDRNVEEIISDLTSILPENTSSDPFEILLYGWLIHADADKFEQIAALDDRDWFIAQLVARADLERIVRYASLVVNQCFMPARGHA